MICLHQKVQLSISWPWFSWLGADGFKPLTDPVLTHIVVAKRRHKALMSWYDIDIQPKAWWINQLWNLIIP